MAVVEGPRAIDGALASGATLEAVLAKPELVDRYAPWGLDEDHPDACRLGAGFRQRIGTIYAVPADVLDPLADAMNPQGVMATAPFADTSLSAAVQAERVVVLEAVRDPGNAGAVVRSAAAAGFGAVIATEGTTDLWSPKALRGAAGLTFGLSVCRGQSTADVLDALHDAGHMRVRATPAGALGLDAVPCAERMALVVGNEAHGFSAQAVDGTDIAVAIPMQPPVDSLNVAVAAAVLMYAMRPREVGDGVAGSSSSLVPCSV